MVADANLLSMALVALAASFIVTMLIVFTERWHGRGSLDNDLTGVQKVHKQPVPRVGGIALLIGIAFSASVYAPSGTDQFADSDVHLLAKLVIAALPAFVAGLMEDLTKRISVATRLVATFASALIASWLTGAYLPRLDTWGIDTLLQITPIAIFVTAIAVSGVANSINLIDGFNGLAGGATVVVLAGMGFLGWQAGDTFIARLAMVGIGATIGFLLFNYPTGRIFMGDGGAYLLGFWIAEVAVLTVVRNPDINAWQVFAICAYPVIEVLYSMYRRKIIRKMSPGHPDRLHLHTLIYRRLICQLVPANSLPFWCRNAMVAAVVMLWITPITLLSTYYGDTVPGALAIVLTQVFMYLAVYARLVRGHWCLNPAVGFGFLPEHRVKGR